MTREQQALDWLRTGRLFEAEQLYLEILSSEPANFEARHFLGVIRFQAGQYLEALEYIGASLQSKRDAGALTSQGNVLQALGRLQEALASYDQALEIQPKLLVAWYNRGVVLSSMMRREDALASYDRALEIDPGDADVLTNRAAVLADLNSPEEALAAIEEVLAMSPHFAEGWHNRGILLQELGRVEDALASYDRALAIKPDYAEAYNSRGLGLEVLERFEEALGSYNAVLGVRPEHVEALCNRANLLSHLKRFQEALASYDQVLAIAPDDARAWNNRGTTLYGMRRVDDALASYTRALSLRPDFAEALSRRGNMLWAEKRDLGAAIRDLEKAISADQDYDYARGELLHLKMQAADWRDFEQQIAAIDAGVRAGRHVIQPLYYLAVSDSPAALQACARAYTGHLFPARTSISTKPNRFHQKIRVGYLSAEFREHPTSYLTAGLFELHDKNRFEIVALDNGWNDDSYTRKRLEAAFGKFIDISRLSDKAVADRIRSEEIDILVDANGYTSHHRMGVFAQKPAPIQVGYLAFPGTLGASYMDYIIADHALIPENERQFYTENVVYLPDSYQANDFKRAGMEIAPKRAEHGLPEHGFVFCNFNQTFKLNPAVFAVWMRILRQVEGSVLWLLESNGMSSENLRRAAAANGVAGERIVFASMVSQQEHLARLRLADLCVDTLPYNCHTTASDALWVGVPLVTCYGKAFAGRVAASLLRAINLPELVTDGADAYEALILNLASDPAHLQAIRDKLGVQRIGAPLFDTDRYRRNIEAAYETMCATWQRGEPAQDFAIPSKDGAAVYSASLPRR